MKWLRIVGRYALDFHSFRHYYCSQVDRAGVSETLARKLARASSGALLDRYTHREQGELAAAVADFPPVRTKGLSDDSGVD